MRYRAIIEWENDYADHDDPARWGWSDMIDEDVLSLRVEIVNPPSRYPTPTPTSRMLGAILAVTGLLAVLGFVGWVESWL